MQIQFIFAKSVYIVIPEAVFKRHITLCAMLVKLKQNNLYTLDAPHSYSADPKSASVVCMKAGSKVI